jgi:hypothetical protein
VGCGDGGDQHVRLAVFLPQVEIVELAGYAAEAGVAAASSVWAKMSPT